jgi:hypothetical protein
MLRRRASHRVASLLAVLACGSCHEARGGSPDSSPAALGSEAPTPPDAAPQPGLPPLAGDRPIVPLAVPGFADAVISIPLGSTGPRPVVVATHGAYDAPEGLCDDQRWVLHDRAWVVCPRGRPLHDGTFRYDSGPSLAREIDAAVSALAARYPGYVDDGARMYVGFSLGAILGAWIVAHDPARFPRAVLIEGGEDRWTDASARAFARGGGQRVLFACGLRGRVPGAQQAAAILGRAGVDAHVVLARLPDAGQFIHWYNGPVADEQRAQLGWLVEGDARWSVLPTEPAR